MKLKLGYIIKKLRTERGMTQEELANKMNVSFQAVSKWENDQTTPDIAILPKLAQNRLRRILEARKSSGYRLL